MREKWAIGAMAYIHSFKSFTCSISLQCPSLTLSGESNVDTISPPVTSASLSIPSKSACSIAITPASANNCSG